MTTEHPETGKDAEDQRRGLLDAQRAANQEMPRNFKDDALTDKVVSVEPDGTGPSSTGSLDPAEDQQEGSGHDAGTASTDDAPPRREADRPERDPAARR